MIHRFSVGICLVLIQGTLRRVGLLFITLIRNYKLPDPYATKFTPETLRQAMTETIAHINELTDDANITEVFIKRNSA